MQYEVLSPFHTELDDNITQDYLGSDTVNSTDIHKTTEDNSVFPFNVNFENEYRSMIEKIHSEMIIKSNGDV